MFHIKNVSKKYHHEFALNKVSLTIGKGLNVIVGASGSGKTTLLKIISGMDQDFEGEVTYCHQNIKELDHKEKSYFYNNIFGFIWQDCHLREDATVLENVMLPQYLKANQSYQQAKRTLLELGIFDFAWEKVRYLSGGQKQRVAIARELMKNPQVIIADEPTSALDQKTSKSTLAILREIAKTKTVIIVTHDTSFITPKDNVFWLDKGEVIKTTKLTAISLPNLQEKMTHKLTLKNAFILAKDTIKNKISRYSIAIFTLVIASVLLLTTLQNSVSRNTQNEFNKLINTYGDSVLDIGLYHSFIDAAGTDGSEANKPNGEINQDISKLYELYQKDPRVSFIAYLQAFDNITITFDHKKYLIKSSGSTPTINKLVAGKMPMGDGNEVVVPESLVKKWGISPNEAIGKEILFDGSIYTFANEKAIAKNTSLLVTIVGVMDTTVKYDHEGKVMEYTVEDSFIFSKPALINLTKQAGKEIANSNFLIRANTPNDMIAIKDEMNQQGIVPIGRFELIEDMVRLNNQTTEQSGTATILISVLAIVMVIAIFLITGLMRKREFAIYQISGFSTIHFSLLYLAETVIYLVSVVLLFLITSPLLTLVTTSILGVGILNSTMLLKGIAFILTLSAFTYVMMIIIYLKTTIHSIFKSGGNT